MWFILLGALVGCLVERAPGPHVEDRGKMTYWLVLDSEGSVTGCTDAQSWQSLIDPPAFDPYTFIIYQVEADGQTAMGQDCARLSPSTCTDNDQIFTVDGHVLTSDLPSQTVLQQGGCALEMSARWEIEDKGATGLFTLPSTFSYTGAEDACTALEEQVRAESPNGLGLDGCSTGIIVNLQLDRIVAKAE